MSRAGFSSLLKIRELILLSSVLLAWVYSRRHHLLSGVWRTFSKMFAFFFFLWVRKVWSAFCCLSSLSRSLRGRISCPLVPLHVPSLGALIKTWKGTALYCISYNRGELGPPPPWRCLLNVGANSTLRPRSFIYAAQCLLFFFALGREKNCFTIPVIKTAVFILDS